jgi:hypothetical protein
LVPFFGVMENTLLDIATATTALIEKVKLNLNLLRN